MSKPYLPFPPAALDQHLIALGKTRSGKSSKLRVIIEYVLDMHTAPVTIIDFKGDWWGLKSDADGKHAGYPIVIFGGKHADVPLNPRAGKAVAELLSGGNRSAILDLKGCAPSDKVRFYIDFISRTFQLQDGGKRYIAIPEAHNVAPKGRVLSPQVGEMLHWTSALAAEGQGMGLILLLDSQRGQKVHNDVLSACETLIACRVIHAADRGAIKDWIDGNGEPKIGQAMLAELANMPRTDAYVWSPECEFGPERITWQMFRTFDSFKPQPPNQKKPKGWADVDLQEVESKLASVIEEQKANDPAELRSEIARLKKELAAGAGKQSAAEPRVIDEARAAGFENGYLTAKKEGFSKERGSLADRLQQLRGDIDLLVETVQKQLRHERNTGEGFKAAKPPQIIPRNIPTPAHARAVKHEGNGHADPEIGTGGKRRILVALAQYPDGMDTRRLSLLTGLSARSGTWSTYLSDLRGRGFIDGRDHLRITEAGITALGNFDPLPTGDELIDYWRRRLGDSGKRAIFDAVVKAYPDPIAMDQLASQTNLSSRSGTWSTYLSELRGLGLIEGRSELSASKELFA